MKQKEISLHTKKQLAEALKKAMQKKPFSKITVSELIAECNINRNTFYYHFEDIYALLHWMLEEEAIEVIRHFDLLVDYEEAIAFVMDYVEHNDRILNCALESAGAGRDEIKRFFYSDFISIVSSVIEDEQSRSGITLDPDYRNFLAQFYTNAITGLLIDWIQNPKTRNRECMTQYLVTTMRDSLRGIFGSGAEPEKAAWDNTADRAVSPLPPAQSLKEQGGSPSDSG